MDGSTSLAGAALLPFGGQINSAVMQAYGIPAVLPAPTSTFAVLRTSIDYLYEGGAWAIFVLGLVATLAYFIQLDKSMTCLVAGRATRLADNAIVGLHPEQFGKSWRSSNTAGCARFLVEIPLTVIETVFVLVRGVLRLLFLLFFWGIWLFILGVLTFGAIKIEMSPPELYDVSATTVDSGIFAYHVVAVPSNIFIDASSALFLPLFNTNIIGGANLLQVIYDDVIVELISADGDYSTNSGSNPTAFFDGFKEGLTHLNGVESLLGDTDTIDDRFSQRLGRRLADNSTMPYNVPVELEAYISGHPTRRRARASQFVAAAALVGVSQVPAFDPINADGRNLNLKPTFDVLRLAMNTVTFFLDIYYKVNLIILQIGLLLLKPVIEFVGDIVTNVMLILGCGVLSPLCFLRQGAQLFLTGLIAFVNLFVQGINLAITFGAKRDAPVALVPDNNAIGCNGVGDFGTTVPCTCHGNLFDFQGGVYPGLDECSAVTYSCDASQFESTGLYSEYRIEGDSKTLLLSASTRETACKHSRRALSAIGHHENMEDLGGLTCYNVCVDGEVLLEACPFHEHATLMPKDVDAEPHVLVYKGLCEEHHVVGSRRRRLVEMPHTSVGSYIQNIFTHTSRTPIATLEQRDKADADAKRVRERQHVAPKVSRQEMEAKIWAQIEESDKDDGSTTFESHSFQCSFPRTSNGKENAVSRYFDNLCLIELANQHAKTGRVTESTSLGSAAQVWAASAKTWAAKTAPGHARRLSEESTTQRRMRQHGEAIVSLAATMRVRWATAKMLLHHPGTLAERLSVLTRSSEASETVHRRLAATTKSGQGTTYWQNTWQHSSAIMERGHGRALEMIDILHTNDHHGRELTQIGIFTPRLVCAPGQIGCPDGKTCVARNLRATCPYPEQWSLTTYVKQGLHETRLSLGQLDVLTFIENAFNDWRRINANDDINPYSLVNRFTAQDDPKLVWPAPLLRDVPFRFPVVKYNFAKDVAERCGTTGCSCPNHFTGQWRLDVEVIRDVPYFIYARTINFLTNLRWALGGLFSDTWLDKSWRHMLGPFQNIILADVFNLFNRSTFSGTYEEQRLCWWFHMGSTLWVIFAVALFTLVLVGMGPAASYILWRLFMLVDFFFDVAVERAFQESWGNTTPEGKAARLADEESATAGQGDQLVNKQDDAAGPRANVTNQRRKALIKENLKHARAALKCAFFRHAHEHAVLANAINKGIEASPVIRQMVREAVDEMRKNH